jgi:hypothetical protein
MNQSRYPILGQFVFWVGLGITNAAWSTPIPVSPQVPQTEAQKLGSLESRSIRALQSGSPEVTPPETDDSWTFSVAANSIGNAIHHFAPDATNNAVVPAHPDRSSSSTSISSFQARRFSEPSNERQVTTSVSTAQSQVSSSSSFKQAEVVPKRILQQLHINATPPAPCWRSTQAVRSACSFRASQVRFGQTSPNSESSMVRADQTSSDLELGTLRLSPEVEATTGEPGTDELGTLRLAPNTDLAVGELGTLRIQPETEPTNNELGTLQSQELDAQIVEGAADPELGTLRLQEDTVPQLPTFPTPPKQASVFLLGRVDYFRTTNVFSGVDPVDDGLIRSGVTLFYAPPLGPKTFLVTSIDANLIRYTSLGSTRPGSRGFLNYDELRFRAGIFHRLTPRMSGEIGWSNQQLFNAKEGLRTIFNGDRFLNDNALRIELSRQDPLAQKLTLNTFYQFRLSFATPNDRSRIINSFTASLSYDITRQLQTGIDYQFAWSHFTQQSRDDVFNQLVARVSYTITRSIQANVFSGFSFGGSTDRRIDFNGFIFGAGLVFNTPLF